jgi:hypothetical protein
MVWIIKDADEAEAIKEITTLSDRAAAILAGALVESRIEQFISDRMIKDDATQREVFRTSGHSEAFQQR